MEIKGLCLSERTEEYIGKKGPVKQVMVTVIDQAPTGIRLTQPLDYALSPEETATHAGKLQDKPITVGISELYVFGGRMRCRGKLLANGAAPVSK